jgi:hypothetical protein
VEGVGQAAREIPGLVVVHVGQCTNRRGALAGTSERRGVELSALYRPLDWIIADMDYAWSHAREAPLIEDNSTRSESTTVVNVEGGYRFNPRLKLQVALLNAFDSGDYYITYFYESQLQGEAAPVEDIHFHPVEPRKVRVSVTGTF